MTDCNGNGEYDDYDDMPMTRMTKSSVMINDKCILSCYGIISDFNQQKNQVQKEKCSFLVDSVAARTPANYLYQTAHSHARARAHMHTDRWCVRGQ